MKRIVYLAMAALVAMLILVPVATAQETMMKTETMMMKDKAKEEVPKTGGPAVGSLLLPAGALLLGSGIVAYAVIRRRG